MSTSDYETFSWRGEPIRDIDHWAGEHGHAMVTYHAERMVPSLSYDDETGAVTPALVKEERSGRMPDVFYDHLAQMAGWHYTELGRKRE